MCKNLQDLTTELNKKKQINQNNSNNWKKSKGPNNNGHKDR